MFHGQNEEACCPTFTSAPGSTSNVIIRTFLAKWRGVCLSSLTALTFAPFGSNDSHLTHP
jgi:hypothetical protein